MRFCPLAGLVVLFGLGVSAPARAQVQIQLGPSTPRVELGAHVDFGDLWSDTHRTLGGRLAKRHADWLMSEIAYDKTSWKYEGRESRLFLATVRLQNPTPDRGRRAFVSLGLARATGRSFEWSPVVISGGQQEAPDGIAALRFELQWFPKGSSTPPAFDRVRLLVGFGIGIP